MVGGGQEHIDYHRSSDWQDKALRLNSLAHVHSVRKLLVILNAMLKHRTPWQLHEAQHA